MGIIQACVPRAQLMDKALEIARTLAAKSPLALATAKTGFNAVREMPSRDAYLHEQGLTVMLSKSAYAREAQTAFVQKRDARFEDR